MHVRAKTFVLSKASYKKCTLERYFIAILLFCSLCITSHPAYATLGEGKRFFSLEKQRGVSVIRPSKTGSLHLTVTDTDSGGFKSLKKYQQTQSFPEVKVLRLKPPAAKKITTKRDFREASFMRHEPLVLDSALPDLPEDGEFIWPVPRTYRQYISSPFGYRNHPITGRHSLHQGIDIAADMNTPVVASYEGVIEEVARDSRLGRYIKISHDEQRYTIYGHLSDTHVQVGQRVTAGTLIGNIGSTGRSTGSHLHYALEVASRIVNPMQFFQPAPRAKKLDVLAANN